MRLLPLLPPNSLWIPLRGPAGPWSCLFLGPGGGLSSGLPSPSCPQCPLRPHLHHLRCRRRRLSPGGACSPCARPGTSACPLWPGPPSAGTRLLGQPLGLWPGPSHPGLPAAQWPPGPQPGPSPGPPPPDPLLPPSPLTGSGRPTFPHPRPGQYHQEAKPGPRPPKKEDGTQT